MKFRLTILLLLFCSGVLAQPRLKSGDLLFTLSEADASTLSGAITGATSQGEDPRIDHVAIVWMQRGKVQVLEATTGKGVRTCPLDTFLFNASHNPDEKPLVLVGRMKGDFDRAASLKRAKAFIGKRYDDLYSPTDDDIYCSELVQKSYVDRKGNLIFSTEPMSFHGPDGQILPFWKEFYRRRGQPVPEGEPGSNPSALSRHPAVEIIGRYY